MEIYLLLNTNWFNIVVIFSLFCLVHFWNWKTLQDTSQQAGEWIFNEHKKTNLHWATVSVSAHRQCLIFSLNIAIKQCAIGKCLFAFGSNGYILHLYSMYNVHCACTTTLLQCNMPLYKKTYNKTSSFSYKIISLFFFFFGFLYCLLVMIDYHLSNY